MLEATVAILNANVVTLNSNRPRAEAIAIQNKKIIAVGSNEEIRKYAGAKTKIMDAKNKTIVPGLVDSHVHMTGFGHLLQTLNLRNIKSIKEMQQKLQEYAQKNPEIAWILGGRWDHEKFAEKRYPTRLEIDAAIADRPVFLLRVCGHIAVANTKALQLAGITKDTKVDGGKVNVDNATGEPNGILEENVLDLVWKAIPKPSQKEIEKTCLIAAENAVASGLTCVHWLLSSANETLALQKLYSEERLPLRIYLSVPVELLDELVNLGLITGFGNDMIKIGFIKFMADGSLGGRTAALKEPYADKPDTRGTMLFTQKKINQFVFKAHKSGLQLGVHAIGDRAVEAVLNAYEKALRKYPKTDHRHRIEHCSVLNLKFIKRMKRLGLIASVQPHFAFSDFWAADRVGKDRASWVYPFKTMMREGLILASGSDCPVEPINPLLGVWAAVTRKDLPEENLTVEEALKTYTVNAAYASFDEKKRGTIETGKFADLTVLSDDPSRIAPDKIREIVVEMVIVNGKMVYTHE